MAEVSLETQAILDRLKQEGQLTRNSGTNSISSVNIQLEQFSGLFNTIATNIVEQTAILRAGMNIQEEAIEAQKRANDLNEIARNSQGNGNGNGTGNDDDAGTGSKKGLLAGIKDVLPSIGKIGKIAGVLGGGFFVANVLRGVINEKFDDAADKQIDKVKAAFGEEGINMADIKQRFTDMQTSLNSTVTNLESLNTKFESMLLKMDAIMTKIDEFSLSWDKILKWTYGLVSAWSLFKGAGYFAKAWELRQNRLAELDADHEKKQRQRNRFATQRNSLLRRSLNNLRGSLGLAPLAPEGSPSGTPPKTGGTNSDDGIKRPRTGGGKLTTPSTAGGTPPNVGNKPPATKPVAKQPNVKTNSGTVPKAEVRADAARKLKGYSLANNGNSLRGPDGKMVSGDAALAELEKTLDPKYSKIFRRISKFVRVTGWGALLVMMFEVAIILNSDMPDDQKKKALARIFLVGASAALFAAAGAMMGSVVPGWGTLIGGLAGGVGGYFAADYVMDSIIEALWGGGNPEQQKIREAEKMSGQAEMNYMGSDQGQRAKALAVAEARAGAGYRGPIDSGGNPMDSVPDDIKKILSGSKRNYFTAGDGTFYGTVPGSGQNLRMEQIPQSAAFLQSSLAIAREGAISGMNPMVVNNITEGSTILNQSTKMGDQNVANIQNISGTGDANPMSLPK